jgi:HAD superfamily hydrolase (TIGR01490 family)
MTGGRPYLVFCDVDETLIATKSMFDFLEYYLARTRGAPGAEAYRRVADRLKDMARDGSPRAEVNRAYYRAYRGEAVEAVERAGAEWFRERSTADGFFIGATVRALAAHRAAGARLTLVSGSFEACLAPVARAVGADQLLCTQPLAERGMYTGEVAEPVIGEGKRTAVRRVLRARPEVSPADCYAYGDHLSDLPMLDCVGHPVAVGDDPELLRQLAARRGQTVPSTRGEESGP